MEKDKLIRMSFAATPELQQKIREHATSKGLSMSSYMRSVVISDMEKSKERANKA